MGGGPFRGGTRAASPWAGPRWIRRCGAVVPMVAPPYLNWPYFLLVDAAKLARDRVPCWGVFGVVGVDFDLSYRKLRDSFSVSILSLYTPTHFIVMFMGEDRVEAKERERERSRLPRPIFSHPSPYYVPSGEECPRSIVFLLPPSTQWGMVCSGGKPTGRICHPPLPRPLPWKLLAGGWDCESKPAARGRDTLAFL